MRMDVSKENPNLTDNWDDAEGYYRKYYSHVSMVATVFSHKYTTL
jgi:hypothetical protein